MLSEIVGKGGFGVVYKGTWKGSVAAVKVCARARFCHYVHTNVKWLAEAII